MKYKRLRDYATQELVVVHWMEKMSRAFQIMLQNRVRHLPVIDDDGAVIGVISERDFHRAMQDEKPDFNPEARVRDFMNWPVEAIDEWEPIEKAARTMIDKKISSLIVTRGNQIVGIVTTEDLLRALVDRSESPFEDLKVELKSAIYRSPIGQIAQALANAGI